MPTCLVALGSNSGHRQTALQGAVASLSAHKAVRVVQQSSWHHTAPVGGPADQAEFVNGAVRLETDLPPSALLALLQQIETAHGRERHERWAARSLDLDLLLYGEQVIETPDLVVPHPRMSFRRFVLEPAAEVAADLRHPQIGWTIGQLLHHLDTAANYLALTGLPGVGKTGLALRLHQHFGGKLIQDRPLRQTDDPDGSQSPSRQIEFFHRRVVMLEPSEFEKGSKSFAVSDFWLGESLVNSAAWPNVKEKPDVEARESMAELWRDAQGRAARPKLILVLDASLETPLETGDVWRSTLHRLIHQGQHGPVLWLDATDADLVWAEATAAVVAMR